MMKPQSAFAARRHPFADITRLPLAEVVSIDIANAVCAYLGDDPKALLALGGFALVADEGGGVFTVIDQPRKAPTPALMLTKSMSAAVYTLDNPNGEGALFKWYPGGAAAKLPFDDEFNITDVDVMLNLDRRTARMFIKQHVGSDVEAPSRLVLGIS
jgi:hypothetical protein